MSAWLPMLGMARRAGAIAVGEEAAAQAALAHKARLILIASDAGESGIRSARLERDVLPVLRVSESRAQLGQAVGFASVAVLAICELGFAAQICARLAAENPQAASAAQQLNTRQEKAMRRRTDTARFGRKSKRRQP